MIFVTVGTTKFPFNRLAGLVNHLTKINIGTKFIIQAGSTKTFKKRPNVLIKKLFDPKDIVLNMKKADLVITHGGEGSIYTALRYSKSKPLVCPRLSKLGEHVDDQQVTSCEMILPLNVISLIDINTKEIFIYKESKKLNEGVHGDSDRSITNLLNDFTNKLVVSKNQYE